MKTLYNRSMNGNDQGLAKKPANENKALPLMSTAKKAELCVTSDIEAPFIGTWKDAAPYQQDNEFIRWGYRINFNTIKRILRSLFMCHNEFVNIWSHLCGVLLFIVFVVFIAICIGPRITFPSLLAIQAELKPLSFPANNTLSSIDK